MAHPIMDGQLFHGHANHYEFAVKHDFHVADFDRQSKRVPVELTHDDPYLRSDAVRYELPIGDAEHDADVDPVVIENACKHEFAHEHAYE